MTQAKSSFDKYVLMATHSFSAISRANVGTVATFMVNPAESCAEASRYIAKNAKSYFTRNGGARRSVVSSTRLLVEQSDGSFKPSNLITVTVVPK